MDGAGLPRPSPTLRECIEREAHLLVALWPAMPFGLDDDQATGRPALVQVPGGDRGSADIATAMDENGGNIGDLGDTAQDLLPIPQKPVMGPVMRDERRKRQAAFVVGRLARRLPARVERDMGRFLCVPGAGCEHALLEAARGQPPGIGFDDALAGAPARIPLETLPG